MLALLLTLPVAVAAAATKDIDCGGGASCPSTNTCCRNGEGGFSCCPVKDATCCNDYVHCCPPEHPVCNLNTGSCTSALEGAALSISSIPWLTKTPTITTTTQVTATLVDTLVEIKKNKNNTVGGAPDCSDNKCLFLVTNPSSPLGKQHCQELDNPNGTSGGYWKAKGWKYTSPPWTQGKCDRTRFNYVNKDTKNLDGFAGVEFWYLGIQV